MTTNSRRGESASARTQSLDRAIRLLLAVGAANPDRSTVAALADDCDLNRATAWRLLTTLESHGLVDRDAGTGRYTIGFTAVQLASAAGFDGLATLAHPLLGRVSAQTGETADLAIVRPLGLTYIDEVTPPSIVAATWLGRAVPLHATSTGKAMLAWLPDQEAASLLAGPLPPYTDTTITNRDALAAELIATRQRGYGVCRGELERTLFGCPHRCSTAAAARSRSSASGDRPSAFPSRGSPRSAAWRWTRRPSWGVDSIW
jgi:DNA-binding IclR family transcriptional regulator